MQAEKGVREPQQAHSSKRLLERPLYAGLRHSAEEQPPAVQSPMRVRIATAKTPAATRLVLANQFVTTAQISRMVSAVRGGRSWLADWCRLVQIGAPRRNRHAISAAITIA